MEDDKKKIRRARVRLEFVVDMSAMGRSDNKDKGIPEKELLDAVKLLAEGEELFVDDEEDGEYQYWVDSEVEVTLVEDLTSEWRTAKDESL